jgi:Lipoprotein amino terminal region
MHSRSLFSRKPIMRLLNVGVVVALLVGTVTPAFAASNAPAQVVQTNAGCAQTPAAANKIFMSVITAPAKAVAAAVEEMLTDPAAVERKLKYEVGKTYVYDYNLNVVTRSNQRNSEGTTSSDQSKTVMAAQVELSITSQEADGTFAGQIIMKTPYVCTADLKAGTDSLADTAELATELQKPLLFKQKSNGVVMSVSFPANARPTVVNMQKGIINALQNVLQEGASYSVAEISGQGTFTPTYTLKEQNDVLNITKDYTDKSFSKMQKQGDDIKSLALTSVISVVLDGPKGVFSSVESSEILETGDGTAEALTYTDPDVKFDGVTSWSTVTSKGKLSLKEVKAASNIQAAALNEVYVDGGLEPIFEKPAANPLGIDLSTVNIAQEIATFEADPGDPLKFARMLDLVAADTTEGMVDKIIERLNANAAKDNIAKSYIDMLTVIATPKAQKALTSVLQPSVSAAGISATMSITTQEQALINLVRIQSPITSTVNTVAALSSNSAVTPLQSIAISVLGATINNLTDEDPKQAQTLADGLLGSLNSAPLEQKELYLEALGNAGLPSTLDSITQYTNLGGSLSISNTLVVTEVVEAAAFNALRKIPGARAEGLLVAALNDTTQPNGTRLLVADVLRDRTDLSSNGAAALANFQIADLAGGGTYTRYWGSWLGNSKLGINFPGSFTVSSVNQLYLYADQQANAYVWDRQFSVARGQLLSQRYNPNPSYQFVGAYLDIAGNRITQFQEYILCNVSRSGNLWANNWRWSQRVSIPVLWVITIDVEVKVTVNVAVDYAYGLNVCNVNNSSLYGGVTPRAWVGVTAEAYLNLRLARGGVGINVTIMNTLLPTQLSLSYNGSNFRFCSDVKVTTNPLSGYIYAFADVGVDYWLGAYWKRVYQGNLATFNVGSYSYPVLVQCW